VIGVKSNEFGIKKAN